MGPILLATDGSEYARAAAERAVDMARDRETALHVLCVVDRRVHDEPVLSSLELQTIATEDAGMSAVEEICRACTDVDVEAEGSVIHGVPAETITEYADEIDAGAIVIGEHGNHTKHLGGVGREVDERSGREVVIVPLED